MKSKYCLLIISVCLYPSFWKAVDSSSVAGDHNLNILSRVFVPFQLRGTKLYQGSGESSGIQCPSGNVVHENIKSIDGRSDVFWVPHGLIIQNGQRCGTGKPDEYMLVVSGRDLTTKPIAERRGLGKVYDELSSNRRARNAYVVLHGIDPVYVGFDMTAHRSCGGRIVFPIGTVHIFVRSTTTSLNLNFAFLRKFQVGMVSILNNQNVCVYQNTLRIAADFNVPSPSATLTSSITPAPKNAFKLNSPPVTILTVSPTPGTSSSPSKSLVLPTKTPIPSATRTLPPKTSPPSISPTQSTSASPTPRKKVIPNSPSGTKRPGRSPSPRPQKSPRFTVVVFPSVSADPTRSPAIKFPSSSASRAATPSASRRVGVSKSPLPSSSAKIRISESPKASISSTAKRSLTPVVSTSKRPKESAKIVSGGIDCFPNEAKVELESGRLIPMTNLTIGDRVRTGRESFSDVFMFTHKDSNFNALFWKFHTSSGTSFIVSRGHYVPVRGWDLKPAHSLRVGDEVYAETGLLTEIILVELIVEKGRHNPQTLDGNIVVDGFIISTYTDAIHPSVAEAILAPIRAAYIFKLWRRPFDSFFDKSDRGLLAFLPGLVTGH